MTTATFYLDSRNVVRKFEISGHSGYAESGSDIICAALSMLVSTVIGSLDELLERRFDYEIREEGGWSCCELTDYDRYSEEERLRAETLMFSALVGVTQAEEAYGKYVKLKKVKYPGG